MILTENQKYMFQLSDVLTLLHSGDLQLIPRVDQLPHLEVPYLQTNGGQQLRQASGCCPVHLPSVTFIEHK